jgi:hypothetical protein
MGFMDFLSSLDPTNIKKTTIAKADSTNTQNFLNQANALKTDAQAAQLGAAPTVQASQLGAVPFARAAQLGAAPTAQAATIDQSQVNPYRQQQQNFLGALNAQAQSTGISDQAKAAQAAATDAALRATQAQAASARGQGAALANRNASMQGAALLQQGAQQAQQIGSAERVQAQQLYGQALQSGMSQEAALAQAQAGMQQQSGLANQAMQGQFGLQQGQFGQQVNLANQQAQQQQQQLQAQLQQQAALANQSMQGQYGLQGGQFQQQANIANQSAALQKLGLQGTAQMGMDQALNATSIAQAQLDAGRTQARQAAIGGLISGAAGIGAAAAGAPAAGAAAAPAAGAAIGTSDARVKKNVKELRGEAGKMVQDAAGDPGSTKEFLDALKPYEFNYVDEPAGTEPTAGIMAQDLEKTRLGRQMVIQDAATGVKKVDFGRGFGALLAGQAELNKRLAAMEGKKASASKGGGN